MSLNRWMPIVVAGAVLAAGGVIYLVRSGRSPAKRVPPVVGPGVFDDFDPAIVFDGNWVHDAQFSQPSSHTVSYINVPGSQIRLAFVGHTLTYIYTKALNRGMADIAIDGVRKARLDLYSPTTQWQARTSFEVAPGRHLAVITVLADKNPASSDRYVDLDGFEVQ